MQLSTGLMSAYLGYLDTAFLHRKFGGLCGRGLDEGDVTLKLGAIFLGGSHEQRRRVKSIGRRVAGLGGRRTNALCVAVISGSTPHVRLSWSLGGEKAVHKGKKGGLEG